MASSNCGTHTELVSNNAVRVTRCACGTVHVTLLASGVTMRMSAEAFRGVAAGLKVAAERIDEANARLGSSCVN